MKKLFFVLLLLALLSCKKETSPITPPAEHFEADGLVLSEGNKAVLNYYRGVTKDTLVVIKEDKAKSFDIKFLNSDSVLIDPSTDPNKKAAYFIGDTNIVSVIPSLENKWQFTMVGKKKGYTTLKIEVIHIDHPDFVTDFLPVLVR